ncbi:MAG TPA: GNAT family N-acetyltransferase [Gemmatimonadaceae bacterium]|nr:GNAT family N-acetyltransferase [Gemmatimonadaceae bacterium]
MTVTVRPATPADYAQWKPLWDGYNAFYERVGPTALPAEITAATWARFHDPAEPVHALVAERDGRLVGLVHYVFHWTTSAYAPTCYLNDLFTEASVRGQGVGRALIEAVYARARAAGSARVYWLTHETNHTAMRLYDAVAEKSGFLHYRKTL